MAAKHPSSELTEKEAREFVDQIVHSLQSMFTTTGITADEVVKGGSLGQGTAVPGHFDLDLVLYSRSIHKEDVAKGKMEDTLRVINAYLHRQFSQLYLHKGFSRRAVMFGLRRGPKGAALLEVDLLPSPFWETPDELHRYLETLSDAKRENFKCSASKWQREFFVQQPSEVREYIRRAKAWRNRSWLAIEDGKPKSFLLGLLVAEAYRHTSGRKTAADVTEKMKELVRNHRLLKVDWIGYGAVYDQKYIRNFPRGPYIIDPANPFNNIYETGIGKHHTQSKEGTYEEGDGNWTVIARKIESLDLTLSSGLFNKYVEQAIGSYGFFTVQERGKVVTAMAYSRRQPAGYYYRHQPPEPLTVADANSFVHEIVSKLQSHLRSECDVTVTEIIKGGSLGQGTAVAGSFDLDLVLYSRDIRAEAVLHRGVHTILRKLDSFLSRHFGVRYESHGLTNHGVRFSLKGVGKEGSIEVDLLPSPYWAQPEDLHSFLYQLSNDQRTKFSCSAAKWQKNFILSQPPLVKEYIKRAKAWRNKVWPAKENGSGRPKSFLIGLLVAEAYRQTPHRNRTDHTITEKMKKLVRHHSSLQVHWTDNGAAYDQKYTRAFPSFDPYIIDPANPFNNVYISGVGYYEARSPEGTYERGDGNWAPFVKNIASLDLSQSV